MESFYLVTILSFKAESCPRPLVLLNCSKKGGKKTTLDPTCQSQSCLPLHSSSPPLPASLRSSPVPVPSPLRRRLPHPSPVTPTCRRPLLTLFATARAAEGCLRSEERMLSPPTGGPECCLLLLFLSIRFAAIEFVHDLVLFHQGFSRYGAAAGGRLLRRGHPPRGLWVWERLRNPPPTCLLPRGDFSFWPK